MFAEDHMIYVYELPPQLSNGYCFGGGVPIEFKNVDWMQSVSGMTEDDVRQFVQKKGYIRDGYIYLILAPTKGWAFYLEQPK